MFAIKSALFALCALAAAAIRAQSLDEISELQKARVIAELRAQITHATRAEAQSAPAWLPPQGTGPSAQRVASPRDPGSQAPSVLAIFGVDSESLQASITEGGGNLRVKQGDITPSGWTVDQISRSALTFSRPSAQPFDRLPALRNKARQKAGPSDPASGLVRVDVPWGDNSRGRSVVPADERNVPSSSFTGYSALPIPIVPAIRPVNPGRP